MTKRLELLGCCCVSLVYSGKSICGEDTPITTQQDEVAKEYSYANDTADDRDSCMTTTTTRTHEIVDLLVEMHLPLSHTLTDMLNDHYTHQTERRGCGYTQAYRALADYVNMVRDPIETDDLRVFANPPIKPLRWLMAQSHAHGLLLETWRNLDENPAVLAYLQTRPVNDFTDVLMEQVEFQRQLRQLHHAVQLEESKIWLQMLVDVVLPRDASQEGLAVLPTLSEKPKVGSCTMAEKFFLDIAHEVIPRKGRVNIIVDDQGKPLLLEKLNMGDTHSCISLAPLMMNGVRLPVGSMLSTIAPTDGSESPPSIRPCKRLKGDIIALKDYQGFWFLRLTTIALSAKSRSRAFTTHFTWQAENGLFGHDVTEMSELIQLAHAQL